MKWFTEKRFDDSERLGRPWTGPLGIANNLHSPARAKVWPGRMLSLRHAVPPYRTCPTRFPAASPRSAPTLAR